MSFSGVSFSSNRGNSFQDACPINPGPDVTRANAGFLGAFGVVSMGERALMPNQDVRMFHFGTPSGVDGGRTFGDR